MVNFAEEVFEQLIAVCNFELPAKKKQVIFFALVLLCWSLVFAACSSSKSFADALHCVAYFAERDQDQQAVSGSA